MKISKADQKEINTIANAMLDKKAKEVISLDMREIGTSISDHFLICSADSAPQVSAICDNVEEMMIKECNRKPLRKQGRENAFWVILDYSNIIVHIFQTEYRNFYRLEELWADSKLTTYTD